MSRYLLLTASYGIASTLPLTRSTDIAYHASRHAPPPSLSRSQARALRDGKDEVCRPNGDEARYVSAVPLACVLMDTANYDAEAIVSSTPGSSEVRHRTKFSDRMSP